MGTEVPPGLVETVARALFEAAEKLPGARVPVIAAEELARAALAAITGAGFALSLSPANDNPGADT